MNKKIRNIATLMVLAFAGTSIATAQVSQQKIGQNPMTINPNAVLDIESNNKGLLLPRLALTATDNVAPLTAHVAGMTVYNTATNGDDETAVTPGYYYNDGTQWVRIVSSADMKTEPWYNQDTNTEATENTQNIYQMAKVGIGSSAPYSALTIVNDNQDDSYDDISIETFGTGGNTPAFIHMAAGGTLASPTSLSNGSFLGSIYFRGFLSDNQYHTLSGIQTKYKGNGTTKLSNMEFYTSNEDADADPKMILTENGNLGIGENNPAQRLEVGSGNVRIHDINTNTGDVTDNVVVADANGVLKTVTAASIASSAEPWKIQNTDTEATDNADNIYQQGKVAVGFTDADGVSDKQLEVKGDFKAQVTDGDIIYGTEIDNPLMPAQSTAHYWMNMATGAYKVATVRADAAFIESNGTATSSIFNAEDSHATMASLQKNGNAKSEIRTENIGNFFMETYNVTDNYGSTISLQNDGLRMVHSETEGAGPNWLSQNNKSEIFVEKEEGVRFSFNDEDGDPKGEYWFPTTTGAAGHVLTRVGGNQTEWSNVSDLIEVSNGLEKNATDVIQLGGNLIKDTKITLDENELEIDATDSDLIISGLDNTKVQATNATTGITDHLLAVDANNNVKALKAAMPKFFYMPSIIIPTSEEQLDAPGSGKLTGDDFDNTSREGTINLYNRYAAQFGGSTLIKSETAAPVLPVLPSGELYYYVTWYDTNVFTSVSVDDEGVLTYEVDENADITVGSFMNIVFAVKEDL